MDSLNSPLWGQFYRYVGQNMIVMYYAASSNSRYFLDQMSFVNSHSEDTVVVSFQEEPISVEWNANPGPAVFLFNVCEDPSESENLVPRDATEHEMVHELYEILRGETDEAPLQFAGDVTLVDAPVETFCSPFLEDDVDLLSPDGGMSLLNNEPSEKYGEIRRTLTEMRNNITNAITYLVGALAVIGMGVGYYTLVLRNWLLSRNNNNPTTAVAQNDKRKKNDWVAASSQSLNTANILKQVFRQKQVHYSVKIQHSASLFCRQDQKHTN